MRGRITLLALVSAPFLASVSQEPAGQSSVLLPEAADDGQCVASEHSNAPSHTWRGNGNGQHLANGWAKQAQRADACDAPPPPPPPSVVGQIDGMSFDDANARGFGPGLPGWTIELRNALTGALITIPSTGDGTTATDPFGVYFFTGLPEGTYLVCEQPQPGWHVTVPGTWSLRPLCPPFDATAVGYTVPVVFQPGDVGTKHYVGYDFGNVKP